MSQNEKKKEEIEQEEKIIVNKLTELLEIAESRRKVKVEDG